MQIGSSWEWPTLGFKLLVTKNVLDLFEEYKQKPGQEERGGQLFVNVSSPDGLILTNATPPHPNDTATPSSLLFNPERCLSEIKALNSERLFLVGYWHTHSEIEPQLSRQDLRTFKKFSRDNASTLPYPIAVIVGLSSIRVWSMRNTPMLATISTIDNAKQALTL